MQQQQPANNKTHSLYFVAIIVTGFAGNEVMKIKQEFAEKYGSKKPLNSPAHITFIMPFYFPDADIETVKKPLKEFSSVQEKYSISLHGFGAFAPKTIFVAVQPNNDLLLLHDRLRTFVSTNIPVLTPYLTGKFTPHVTVGNRDLTKGNFKNAWEVFEHRHFEKEFVVNCFSLLRHNGNYWETFCDFPFSNSVS